MVCEMKKFYKNSAVIISLVLAILLSIVMPIFFINSYESYDYSTGKEVIITGLDGFEARREKIQKTSGVLNIEKLNDALTFYKSLPKGETAYFQMEEEYPGIFFLLKEAYMPITGSCELPSTGSCEFQISNLANVDNFYDRNIKKIEGKIDLYVGNSLSNSEKQEALKRAYNIEKPFTFEFIDGWPILIKSLFFVYFAIIFSAIIISNQIFSFEKEQNMDIILNAAGRKNLISIGFKKVLALCTYLTLEFLICSIIVSSIVFGFLGVSGWNAQIQILPEFFMVIHNLSFGQLYIYYMIIAWISILCIALIGAFINSIFQKTYTSLIVSSLLIVPPMFLRNSGYLPMGVKKFLHTQPINGVNLFSFIISLYSYNLINRRVLTLTAVLVFVVGCSIICISLSPLIFEHRINR